MARDRSGGRGPFVMRRLITQRRKHGQRVAGAASKTYAVRMTDNSTRRLFLKHAGWIAAGGLSAMHGAAAMAAPCMVELKGRGGRNIAVRKFAAAGPRQGTIFFSHGALSSPAHYDLLILPWVQAGYDVWAPLHIDSLAHPERASFPREQWWPTRIEDMQMLAAHVGARSCIAAGHSFGGLVALTMGGAAPVRPPDYEGPLSVMGVRCAVAFSPPGPMPGLVEQGSYADIAVPALIQTGTQDLVTPPGARPDPTSWRKHLIAYDEAKAGGDRYGLVLDGVDHYFGGAICDYTKPGPPRRAEATQAAAIATLFMDGFGRGKQDAQRRLDGMCKFTGPITLRRK